MLQFVAKAVGFTSSLAVLLYVAGAVIESSVPWREYQDPRTRLLWDGHYDGSRLVLLGDSAFCSFYVDSPDQTIWADLSRLTKEKVFPGALNGAKPDDLIAGALQVADEWPENSVVLVNLAPTRFVKTRVEEPAIGNYPEAFLERHGIDPHAQGPVEQVEAFVYGSLLEPFFLVHNRDELAKVIDQPAYFRERAYRNRIWSKDRSFSRGRFVAFESNVILQGMRPMDWLAELRSILKEEGIRVVFVLSPLNTDLIRTFAPPDKAEQIEAHLDNLNRTVHDHLEKIGADVLDLSDVAPSECFADLVHTNACGDAVVARELARWIASEELLPK